MDSFEQFEPDLELEEDNSGIWLSISDLMSGLLMFFALLFIVVQVQLQEYQELYKKLPLAIQQTLQQKLGDKYAFEVDPETGGVTIGDSILFDEGSAELKPVGKQFLREFIPIYSDVIFSDKLFDRQITRVVIEGHTSSKGSEKANMELSLRRALSVSDYIFSQQLVFKTKQQFKQKILASGRGEIDANQSQDNSGDRFERIRILLPQSSVNILGSHLNHQDVEILQQDGSDPTEVCIFDFGAWFVVEFFRGNGSETRLFTRDIETEQQLFNSQLSIKKLRCLGLNRPIHDHVFCWQYFCERWLKQHDILPNQGTTHFKGVPYKYSRYSELTGLPEPTFENKRQRDRKLQYWREEIARFEREARE